MALSVGMEKGRSFTAAAGIVFATLMFSGALDVWRTVSGQVRTRVFDQDAIRIAEIIMRRTPPNALFLNAATYNSAVVLTGRRSLMRYPGHLSSHGIDYRSREEDVKQMYRGGPAADELLAKYGIDHAIVSPEEMGSMNVNKEYFNKFQVVADSGGSRVYKIK